MQSFKDFIIQIEKPQNHINDPILNQKLSNFKNALNAYTDSLTRYMTSNTDDDIKSISLPRDLKEKNNNLYKKRVKELDENADAAYPTVQVHSKKDSIVN